MNNPRTNWSAISSVCAFLIGAILFWSFAKNWLNLESAAVVLAGLAGVAIAVLAFRVWSNIQNPHHEGK